MKKSSGDAAAKRPDGMPIGTPFKKGQSGNPDGRAKGSVSIKAELQKLINLTLQGEVNPLTDLPEDDMPVGRKIALNMVMKAVADADMLAALKIMEQLDGKAAQSNINTNETTVKGTIVVANQADKELLESI